MNTQFPLASPEQDGMEQPAQVTSPNSNPCVGTYLENHVVTPDDRPASRSSTSARDPLAQFSQVMDHIYKCMETRDE